MLLVTPLTLAIIFLRSSCTLIEKKNVYRASAIIFRAVPGEEPTETIGSICLTQIGVVVMVDGRVSGLSPGLHGFHVHEKGDLGNGCLAAGAHFNPSNMTHGAPSDKTRHVGDLGNIETSSETTKITIFDNLISLHGPNSVVGRALVIHADPDDLNRGNSPLSNSTGNAGARVACGRITEVMQC